MSQGYDAASYEAGKKEATEQLVEQLELMIMSQEFTHPRLFSILRDLYVAPAMVFSLLKLSEMLKVEGFHPNYYKVVNRKLTELLNPILDMYRPPLAREGDAILHTKERDKRIRVIKSKGKKIADKIGGMLGGSGSDTEETDTS